MRAAAILGPGSSSKDLQLFQTDAPMDWRIGLPSDSDEADVILVFGGDGTIHRHLTQLVNLGRPVLMVPVGSGNDFARSLGLRRVRDSVKAWRCFCAAQKNVRAIDLGVITRPSDAGAPPTPHYFCSVAGVGLDGEVARRANGFPRWLRRHGGYALALVPAMFRFAPLPMKILIPDQDRGWITRSDQPTMLAAFANTSTYGGGMKIAPQAQMDDGQLDVCIIGSIHPARLACLFPTVYSGRHVRINEVDYFKATRIRVETERPLSVYADGECVGPTPIEVSVQSAALRIITL